MVELEDDLLKADGFDDAIIGTVERCGSETVLCYDYNKCVEILMEYMSEEEAVEYMDFNVVGAYVGEKTPFFLRPFSKDDME
jgi:hypothetical protein